MTAARTLHRCDELCCCPVHGTALYFAPASNEHACQNPTCRYAHGISAEALLAATLGLPMPEDTSVFARFVAARRADPDRLQVPAQPIAETLRGALLENRHAAAVPDAELQQILDRLPTDPVPAAYDEDQALGRMAYAADALHEALEFRNTADPAALAAHEQELQHLGRRLLDTVALVLTQREPSIARPASAKRPPET
ncbi:hypothetical protein ACFUIW_34105 [Streptomyces sp. NPDC057245]|uniref:hypothetical protein n=1 Tax=Streptomyces sp. NPDC057245 TaxID=3346065 RepID=UPI003639C78C